MLFNKKSKMMVAAVELKLRLIEDLLRNVDEESSNHDCYTAQVVILKEVLRELNAIEDGKAIAKL